MGTTVATRRFVEQGPSTPSTQTSVTRVTRVANLRPDQDLRLDPRLQAIGSHRVRTGWIGWTDGERGSDERDSVEGLPVVRPHDHVAKGLGPHMG